MQIKILIAILYLIGSRLFSRDTAEFNTFARLLAMLCHSVDIRLGDCLILLDEV